MTLQAWWYRTRLIYDRAGVLSGIRTSFDIFFKQEVLPALSRPTDGHRRERERERKAKGM
jgi:hypothetical protein